jgi:pyruvate dehydrogenase E2 component (dihydrolipoamide acetyltransferase)
MKAVVAALKAYPQFNASLDADREEIIFKHYYHVGVAVDTERGLIVPVVRDVDRKSITELAIEVYDLAERTRAGQATLDELRGGTFTITNIGVLGGTGFAPIINYPEVAILGMARARLQPVVRGDLDEYEIVPRLIMPLVLAFDHRVLDGVETSYFVQKIIDALEDPEKLFLTI